MLPADKNNNIYEVEPEVYVQAVRNSITQHYKKADKGDEKRINQEAKRLATDLNIADRAEQIAHTDAFITLKDHKENFHTNPKYRLINPAKSELGIVSKQILQPVNLKVRAYTQSKQWRNTKEVIDWFKTIQTNDNLFFIQLDIVDFYASISEEIFNRAIEYARTITDITDNEYAIINNARKSLLFFKEEVWCKKNWLVRCDYGGFRRSGSV